MRIPTLPRPPLIGFAPRRTKPIAHGQLPIQQQQQGGSTRPQFSDDQDRRKRLQAQRQQSGDM